MLLNRPPVELSSKLVGHLRKSASEAIVHPFWGAMLNGTTPVRNYVSDWAGPKPDPTPLSVINFLQDHVNNFRTGILKSNIHTCQHHHI